MQHSDNYDMAKSMMPQDVNKYTPFTSKNWNYINDINSGVYASSNAQIQFDLSSIYNSADFCDLGDALLCIPITTVALCTTDNGVPVAPSNACASLITPKSGFHHYVHQCDLKSGGKSLHDQQAYQSLLTHFKLMSQLNENDLKQFGSTLGLGNCIDSEKSMRWVPVAGASLPGVGLCNNVPFLSATVPATENGTITGIQNANAINKSLQKRCTRLPAVLGLNNTYNNIFGASDPKASVTGACILDASQLSLDFTPYYTVLATNYMVWYDLAIIPLKHLFNYCEHAGMIKKMDLLLTLYVNVGTVTSTIANSNAANLTYGLLSNNTFAQTIPFNINYLPGAGGIPDTTTKITVGTFISKVIGSTISIGTGTINLSSSGAQHFMQSSRIYYTQITIEPLKAIEYIESNREKLICYERFIFNRYVVPRNGFFSQLIQSGIRNPQYLILFPLISSSAIISTTVGQTSLGFEQYASPYDTCPSTYSPLSLINLQVSLGNTNVLANVLNYGYENFIEQVSVCNKLTSSDMGIGVGLLSQSWWLHNKVYVVDLSRGRDADKNALRNLTVSFTNNTNYEINLMCYTCYLDEVVVDVETGIVHRLGD